MQSAPLPLSHLTAHNLRETPRNLREHPGNTLKNPFRKPFIGLDCLVLYLCSVLTWFMKVRGQFSRISSVLPPCGFCGSNWACQAYLLSSAMDCLLCSPQAAQQIIELQEAAQINAGLQPTNLGRNNSLHDMKTVVKTWRNRLPIVSDDLSHWSSVFMWRQHHYQGKPTWSSMHSSCNSPGALLCWFHVFVLFCFCFPLPRF